MPPLAKFWNWHGPYNRLRAGSSSHKPFWKVQFSLPSLRSLIPAPPHPLDFSILVVRLRNAPVAECSDFPGANGSVSICFSHPHPLLPPIPHSSFGIAPPTKPYAWTSSPTALLGQMFRSISLGVREVQSDFISLNCSCFSVKQERTE